MKSAVFAQQCTVTAFGEGIYWRVLQEGEKVLINTISHLTEEKSASFSLNVLLDILKNWALLI
jgi:hypothetical protein